MHARSRCCSQNPIENLPKSRQEKAPEIEAKKETFLYARLPEDFLGFLRILSNPFGFPEIP